LRMIDVICILHGRSSTEVNWAPRNLFHKMGIILPAASSHCWRDYELA
jgi:hypothetical protein